MGRIVPSGLLILAVLILSVPTFSDARAVGDIDRGRELAREQCVQCHPADGSVFQAGVPYLAGQKYGYLVRTMLHFRFEQVSATTPGTEEKEVIVIRRHPIMTERTRDLTVGEIRSIASFYATRSCERPVPAGSSAIAEPESAARCEICHGGKRSNPWADSPWLSGQDPDYLYKELRRLWRGATGFDESRDRHHRLAEIMFESVDEAELRALADYYAALPCPQ